MSNTAFKPKFSFASISDIHLNHSMTLTGDILDNLNRFLLDPVLLTSLDAIFIVGDFWDRLVDLENVNSCEIKTWINKLLHLCKYYDLYLFVLEGTFSHDRKQSRVFETENNLYQIGAKVKWVKEVSIIHLDDHDLNLLFVPDDWKPNPEDTWKDVLDVLHFNNLGKVDFAFTHGTYEHHLPAFVKTPRHINSRYESIVKHVIMNGHIHIHSINGKIITHGSFDRLHHGEEAAKGFVKVDLFNDDTLNITFIENTNAKKYISVDCRDLSIDESLDLIVSKANVPDRSVFRIIDKRNGVASQAYKTIKDHFPQFDWSPPKIVDIKTQNIFEPQANLRTFVTTTNLSDDNIREMAMERIKQKLTDTARLSKTFPNDNVVYLSAAIEKRASELLDRIIENVST